MIHAHMAREIDEAILAHGQWKARLAAAVRDGQADISSQVATREDRCAFGAWLNGPSFAPEVRSLVEFQKVRALHALFHQAAGRVVSYVEQGKADVALSLLRGEFTQRSEELVSALREWKASATTQAVRQAASGW